MRTIKLYGELGEKFGKEYTWDVKNVKEAISLLCANFKEFKQHLIDSDTRLLGYEVWDGEKNLSEDDKESFFMNGSKDIKIIPIIQGASAAGRILTGVAIIAVAWMTWGTALASMPVYGAATWGLGMSLVIGGVIELLSPKPNLTGNNLS